MKRLFLTSIAVISFFSTSLSGFAEVSVLAEITGFDGKKTYEVHPSAAYRTRELEIKKQNKYFPRAMDKARAEWMKQGKVFYNSGIMKPSIRQVKRFTDSGAAEAQKEHFTMIASRPKKVGKPIGGSKKGKKGKKGGNSSKFLAKKDPKKEAARDALEKESFDHFKTKLDELIGTDTLGLGRNSTIDFATN